MKKTDTERPNLAQHLPGAVKDVKEGSLVQARTTRTGIYVKNHKLALLGNVDIFEAIRMGFKDVVIDILERDPTLASKKDFGGTTPLHVATFFKDVEISRILIEHGATLYEKDAVGVDPFRYLERKDESKCANLRLLEIKVRGHMVLSEEERDFMDLRLAAFNNDVAIIEKLVLKNPNLVFAVDERRQTALIAACSNGRREAAMLLLFHGSDWHHKSLDGGGQAAVSSYIVEKGLREELRTYAYWQSPKGKVEWARLEAIRIKDEELDRESNERELMGKEDNYSKFLLACAAITRSLILHVTEDDVLEKAFRLGGRVAERYHVKVITDEIERKRKAEVLARRMAREEAKRKRNAELKAMKTRVLLVVKAVCRWRLVLRIANKRRADEKRRREFEEEQRRLWELAEKKRLFDLALEEARVGALKEWEQLQKEIARDEWNEFCKTKPVRIVKFLRMRKSCQHL